MTPTQSTQEQSNLGGAVSSSLGYAAAGPTSLEKEVIKTVADKPDDDELDLTLERRVDALGVRVDGLCDAFDNLSDVLKHQDAELKEFRPVAASSVGSELTPEFLARLEKVEAFVERHGTR